MQFMTPQTDTLARGLKVQKCLIAKAHRLKGKKGLTGQVKTIRIYDPKKGITHVGFRAFKSCRVKSLIFVGWVDPPAGRPAV